MALSEKEKKDKITGVVATVGVHMLLLLAFLFIMAWKAPNPPAPEIGIDLIYGDSPTGSGTEQPKAPSPQPVPDAKPVAESVKPQPQPEAEPEPVVTPLAPTPKPVTETAEKVVTQPEPSPVTVKEEPKPKPQPQPKPTPKPEEKKPTVNNNAMMPGAKDSESSATTTTNTTSKGDQPGTTGNQGDERGKLDGRASMGSPGGGDNGPALNLSGWKFDHLPSEKDNSTEEGRVTIEFTVDDQGYVISSRIKETSVSLSVAQFYKRQVEKSSFERTAAGVVPPTTTGTVTYIIKSR